MTWGRDRTRSQGTDRFDKWIESGLGTERNETIVNVWKVKICFIALSSSSSEEATLGCEWIKWKEMIIWGGMRWYSNPARTMTWSEDGKYLGRRGRYWKANIRRNPFAGKLQRKERKRSTAKYASNHISLCKLLLLLRLPFSVLSVSPVIVDLFYWSSSSREGT